MLNNDVCEFFTYWEDSWFKNISELLILSGKEKRRTMFIAAGVVYLQSQHFLVSGLKHFCRCNCLEN